MLKIDTSRIGNRRIVASVSGGKDSAAMCLALLDAGIDHDRVFLDTGWEHAATYEYLRGPLTDKLGPITEIRGDLQMVGLIRKKAMFPSRVRRYCTQLLKVKPMQTYLAARSDEVVNCVGIRAGESQSRARMTEWEWSEGFDCEVWRPILAWSEQDVIDIHARHGLRPNPLYMRGARRVGCWPCIFASKAEIRLVADIDPDRIGLIRQLESEVTAGQAARKAAKGETLDNPSAFFQASGAQRSEGRSGRCVPIDEVVQWSRTAHGGHQFELFGPAEHERGCMRWGLCETSEPAVVRERAAKC